MQNYLFISPDFPKSYYLFAKALAKAGFRVLGVASTAYDDLRPELKEALTEYYRVNNMEDYSEMRQAAAYFVNKYGPLDFVESNNEYWLELEAKLRSEFQVSTGKNNTNIIAFKSKEAEKEYYQKAGVKTARYSVVKDLESAKQFIKEVGYPIIAKPDIGVGASNTYKIENIRDLEGFFAHYDYRTKYLMEEYVEGDLISFDGITNSTAEVVFSSNEVFPYHIMDVVNHQGDVYYYSNIEVPLDLETIGKRVLKAFDARYRYFHLEFFRMSKVKKGLGKKGDIIGLEANMRCPGGYTPDMINFAHSVDTYSIYAQSLINDKVEVQQNGLNYYCVYGARRNGAEYVMSSAEIMNKYANELVMHDYMPTILAFAMGDEFFVVKTTSYQKLCEFRDDVLQRK
ncbi:MAG: carbamoylphosphate synthase large subunit [Bacilli bacterium]